MNDSVTGFIVSGMNSYLKTAIAVYRVWINDLEGMVFEE